MASKAKYTKKARRNSDLPCQVGTLLRRTMVKPQSSRKEMTRDMKDPQPRSFSLFGICYNNKESEEMGRPEKKIEEAGIEPNAALGCIVSRANRHDESNGSLTGGIPTIVPTGTSLGRRSRVAPRTLGTLNTVKKEVGYTKPKHPARITSASRNRAHANWGATIRTQNIRIKYPVSRRHGGCSQRIFTPIQGLFAQTDLHCRGDTTQRVGARKKYRNGSTLPELGNNSCYMAAMPIITL
ncbi:hypothetical protein Acr_20g0003860 [Actinidia rufa]|uniref:Uncharacterized protein n=1 Tax=Actinidia rufa TaxID=165716 RepID=A0A7J0GD13_9ERIC|nr:hypothetical protein Acr_20g0003860 [Actinidia rufa]